MGRLTRGFAGHVAYRSAPGPQAAENGVPHGPGAVFFPRPQVRGDPQRDDGGRVAEDHLDLLDARPARDERGGVEVPQIVGDQVRQRHGLAAVTPGRFFLLRLERLAGAVPFGLPTAVGQGDTAAGEPVKFGGSKLSPDLSIHRLRERFTSQPDAPVTAPPAHPWRQAERSLRSAHAALTDPNGDVHRAQGEIAAFGDFLHAAALHGPHPLRAEIQAAASAFNRANRSMIRADHRAAHALRKAGQELLYGTNSAGNFVIAVLAATVHLALAAAHWHEQRDHPQQAAAGQRAHARLRSTYEAQAAPILSELIRRTPPTETGARYEGVPRATLPAQVDRILACPAWPALTTALRRAEAGSHSPASVLSAAAEGRELDTADHPAQVLIWRLDNASSRRLAAAKASSTMAVEPSMPAVVPADSKVPPSRRRGR